ncbi:MAG TPA: hypothetical protein VEW93_11460 [Acidimicrobiales bacterium]|nr:hypothetical protein [Acidimicrobiales bacterium]
MAEPERTTPVAARDEGRHRPGPEPLWNESWYFDFAAADGSLGGYVRLGLYPNLGVAWYWACLVGEGRPLVTVIDHDVPLPRTGLEVRSEGLWADHNLETALDHWSLGCEAFAVGVDDPTEVYGDLRGDRVPFGLDLEWETDGGAYAYPGVDRYEVPCRVTGEVLVGAERIEVDGPGQRDHSWGARDWWTYGWCWSSAALDDGSRTHATHVTLGDEDLYATGYVQAPDGLPRPVDGVRRGQDLGPTGLPTAGWVHLGGQDGGAGAPVELAVAPVAFAPVLLTAPDGREARFPRALCRYTAADGRTGVGWTEWNQPPPG